RVGSGPVWDLGVVRLAPPTAIRGRVLDVDGRPAAATVHAAPEKTDSAPADAGWLATVRYFDASKQDGVFVLADLPAGRWSVRERGHRLLGGSPRGHDRGFG